jgi:phenylpropionate dioxygenase-like ring-hydroxylating dioxygenase large terminal subunit
MFINFWYVAGESKDLMDKPLHVKMLGHEFALFRDSDGQAHCLSNMCSHRGGSLAHGKINFNCLECPYHGWRYNGEGRCVRIPSIGREGKIPKPAKVDSYPVIERYGLIHVFLGDLPEEERPPIMPVIEWEQEGWRTTVVTLDWDISYRRSMENGVDPGHNEFTHTTHIADLGEDEYFILPEFEFEETEWTMGFAMDFMSPALQDEKMIEASGKSEPAVTSIEFGQHGVSCLWTFIYPVPGMKINQYIYETPVDINRTKITLICARNILLEPESDANVDDRNLFVAQEDRATLERLLPKRSPETRTQEIILPADKPILRFRERLKHWEYKGWRIDVDEMRRVNERAVTAIPSPARREDKNWICDPVPLFPRRETR